MPTRSQRSPSSSSAFSLLLFSMSCSWPWIGTHQTRSNTRHSQPLHAVCKGTVMHWREFQSLQLVVELGERFISYVDQGAGMPVLLLHGIPMWGYLWHGLLPPLAASYRVLIPDLLGFGYSDKRDCFDRSIARQVEMIDAWMEEMHVERAHIIGHDIGGGVALRLATLFPHRVARLCVLDTVCYDSWPGSRALI